LLLLIEKAMADIITPFSAITVFPFLQFLNIHQVPGGARYAPIAIF
jgi:hypothetical protein